VVELKVNSTQVEVGVELGKNMCDNCDDLPGIITVINTTANRSTKVDNYSSILHKYFTIVHNYTGCRIISFWLINLA